MKKIFLILLIAILGTAVYGQTYIKRGLVIGNGTTGSDAVTMDSVILNDGTFEIYNGATKIFPLDNIFNVLAYGATGDGSTDDVIAINAAVTAATAAGGGIVFAPEGTYCVTAPIVLKSNVVFSGAGRGITTVKASDSWVTMSQATIFTFAVGDSNIVVEKLTIDGNSGVLDGTPTAGPTAMYTYNGAFTHNDHVVLRHLEIKDTYQHGLTLYSSPGNNHWLIDDVILSRCGALTNSAGMFLAGTNYLTMNAVTIDSAWQHGVYNSFGHDLLIQNSIIINSGIRSGTGTGLSIRADSNVVINGNIVNFSKSSGIYVIQATSADSVTNVVVSNNVVRNNGTSGISAAYAKNVKISGNIIKRHHTNTGGTGVDAGITTTYGVKDLVIENNSITAPVGIYVSNFGKHNLLIQNNKINNAGDNNMPLELEYGVRLYNSDVGSYNVIVKGNFIDTAVYGISVGAGWDTEKTIIEGNIIHEARTARVSNSSTAAGMKDIGNYGNFTDVLATKLDVASPTGTGVATFPALKIGAAATAAQRDSVTIVSDQLASYVGADTTAYYTPHADRQDISAITTIPTIVTAAADTSGITPGKVGDIFIDTSASKVYISKGAARGDWLILNFFILLAIIRRRRK